MNNVEPIGARVIIEPEKLTETDSGILRADQGQATPVKGTVKAAGKDSQFKVGDILFFRRYSVDDLKMPMADGTEQSLFICDDADIVARLIVNP